jgi:serpin B
MRTFLKRFTLLCVAVMLAGCSLAPAAQAGLVRSSQARVAAPAVPAEDGQALAQGNNGFALDLYQILAGEEDGNLFFSPYSISLALAMTYAGARGSTQAQMADALHFTLPEGQLHPAFNALDQTLAERAKSGG